MNQINKLSNVLEHNLQKGEQDKRMKSTSHGKGGQGRESEV